MKTINPDWIKYSNLKNLDDNRADKYVTVELDWFDLGARQYRLKALLDCISKDTPLYNEIKKDIAILDDEIEKESSNLFG